MRFAAYCNKPDRPNGAKFAPAFCENDTDTMKRTIPGLPLSLPVFAAPMFLISGPDLVLAACKAGVIGAFPTPNAGRLEEGARLM